MATNSSTAGVANVFVTDDYDERLAGTPFNLTSGGIVSSGAISWDLGTIPAGGSVTLTYDTQILPTVNEEAILSNFAMIGGNGVATDFDTVRVLIDVNDAPVAADDDDATNEDTPVAIPVLANDDDKDGDALLITGVGSPTHGTAVINSDNTITYTPAASFHGNDSFTYTSSDGAGGTATATVTVQVRNLVDLAGRVFDDLDNDGAYEPGDGEAGIGGVAVQLVNQASGATIATRTTAADGSSLFDVNLGPARTGSSRRSRPASSTAVRPPAPSAAPWTTPRTATRSVP